MAFVVVSNWLGNRGERAPLLVALRGYMAAAKQEPGLLSFRIAERTASPDEFLLFQEFVDEAAWLAHREGAAFREQVEIHAVAHLFRRELRTFLSLEP